MAKKYLDENGLLYFWQKIKAYGNTHWGGGGGSVLDFYPVGSYYETSDTSFDPNTAWGGTWLLETEGQVHISGGSNYIVDSDYTDSDNGDDTVGTSQGGSESIQAHTHSNTIKATFPQTGDTRGAVFVASDSGISSNQGTITNSSSASYNYIRCQHSGAQLHRYTPTIPKTDCTMSGAVGAVSGVTTGGAGNLQPYIVVNRWHRIA